MKDITVVALEGFWKEKKKGKPAQLRHNAFGYDEDDAFNVFWEKAKPKPRSVTIQQPQQIPVRRAYVQPQSAPQGLTQAQQYQLARQRLQLQAKIRQQQIKQYARQQSSINKTKAFIGSLFKGAVKNAREITETGYNKAHSAYKKTDYYKKIEEKRIEQEAINKNKEKIRSEKLKGIREGIENKFKSEQKKAYIAGYNK